MRSVAIAVALGLGAAGCSETNSERNLLDETGDRIEDATTKRGPLEKLGESISGKAEDVGEKIDETVEEAKK